MPPEAPDKDLASLYASPHAPTPELRDLVTAALRKQPAKWRRPHTGLSSAQRFVVTFEDGSRAFVKAAVDEATERWLRVDHQVMSTLDESFVPQVLAWVDSGKRPALVIEDLSRAHWPADHWPVLWKPGQFAILFETLRRLGAVPAPAWLPPAALGFAPRWTEVAAQPEDFLKLGLCSEEWFRRAIDGLVEAEQRVDPSGQALLHGDVRSDNVCFLGERMVLVDWSNAGRGNPQQDVAWALSTLPLEGGPDPHEVMPDGGPWAAYQAGVSARRAFSDARAPAWLIRVVKRIAVINLQWAARSLDLPAWTGLDWSDI